MKRLIPVAALILLSACRTESEVPEPVAMTSEAVGYYCQMNVLEHPGPKGQVHLKDMLFPLFFSQARDAIAYQRMPEQEAEITAIYVSDMAKAPSWEEPGTENWVALEDAVFVVGSTRAGGMGASETVPFSDKARAEAFAAEYGGQVMTLAEIPDSAVLEAADKPATTTTDAGPEDYAARLRALSQPAESKP
ncbi:MAG TPA: nitrous oxide reductase accessory protein NosL [Paracoccus sp. (in: a-proteobacteria)]|uniref:nitrous oxide reductase accessory protein NosL n=1 Tax=uncultured Paracoccus sp. TaxID=189685 RepID=UPI002605171B|nr:nitrous oxide reductase accessory protein NosL [uncultured Paracoccus sp.]HMQ40196.1 nitrous oxide reductase accessory protein NosL [Paracoccus sp. (in: a-proteobacteria)]HMR37332.1 nitrous oxide reductase accessory protein NosL [Paracoccus sp. (in: a-proteobacteria)]